MDELEYLEKPSRVIGRYALYGRLAAGGMATVHFGRLLGPAGFSRTVAIKRLHPQFAKDPEFVAMFLDEARLAARIQHPNVVATVDVVAMSEELFLVMDYIRGESFSRLLRASRKRGIDVSIPVIASVIVGMLHGLHAAHEAKDEQGRPLSVVHRDVSPQNVLVGVDGVARVLDFGVAKASARVQITRDGQMKGKLAYMAPEQLQGRGVDRRTDLFAAGIVFWEALTGRRLFDAEDPSDVLHMITEEDIPPPSAVAPHVSRAVDDLVMKALTRDVNQRFQTARAFAIAVEEAIPLASAREVGEWVERVAGETLLNRERAVAEIEATSSVSDMGALDAAPFPAPLSEVHLPPSALEIVETPDADRDPAMWDEAPTNVIDPARLILEDAARTRVQVPRPSVSPAGSRLPPVTVHGPSTSARSASSLPPRPSSTSRARTSDAPAGTLRGLAPPKPPSSRPPAHGSSGRPSSRSSPASAAPSTPLATPPPSLSYGMELPKAQATLFDDENETTTVFGAGSLPPVPPAPQLPPVPPASAPPVFDDENETTNVIEPSAAGKLLSRTALPQYAVPTRPRNTRPPTLSAEQLAASRTAPPTVIIREDTPAELEKRPSAWSSSAVFLWSKRWSPVKTVAVAAMAAGLLAGVFLVTAGRSGGAEPAAATQVEVSPPRLAPQGTAPEKAPSAAGPEQPSQPEPVPAAPAPPLPLPAAKAEEPAEPPSATKRSSTRTKAIRVARSEPGSPSEPVTPAPAVEPTAAPVAEAEPEPAPVVAAPAADDDEELLTNPYTRNAEAAAAAPAPAPRPAAPKATGGKRDCKKPYYLDADGIRRVKPECLP